MADTMVIYSKYVAKSYNDIKRANRKDMAKLYRKVRKDNPAIARLLFRRQKEASERLINIILYGE